MTVRIRAAAPTDVRLLFDWANEPDSLAASLRTTESIPWAEHQDWFARRLADENTAIFIAETDDEPVGQVRLQHMNGRTEVSIYVARRGRRQGVAAALLRHGLDTAQTVWPQAPLVARIKPENIASRRLFEAAGYRLRRDCGGHLELERDT